jgi:dTDP-4-dehydrorhamnose 3,5-epimerase
LLLPQEYLKTLAGIFFEAYNQAKFQENGIEYQFIQDNQSFSKRGVIRGLHLQTNPFAQAKLARVLEGETLRDNSKPDGYA